MSCKPGDIDIFFKVNNESFFPIGTYRDTVYLKIAKTV